MKPETGGKIKFGSWGLICGALIAIIIGFGWGGWTTAGTTQRMAHDAVMAGQTAICVAQFMEEPNHEEKLAEFEKEDSWKRNEFISKGGWDKMPGQKEASHGVARECSDEIEALMKN